jgi:hypothetical protein
VDKRSSEHIRFEQGLMIIELGLERDRWKDAYMEAYDEALDALAQRDEARFATFEMEQERDEARRDLEFCDMLLDLEIEVGLELGDVMTAKRDEARRAVADVEAEFGAPQFKAKKMARGVLYLFDELGMTREQLEEARQLARKYFWRAMIAEKNEDGAAEWAQDAQVTIEILERQLADYKAAERFSGRCRDCKYWLPHKGASNQGDCTSKRLMSDRSPWAIVGDSLVYGEGYGYGNEYLYTMSGFGCIHSEGKTKGDK